MANFLALQKFLTQNLQNKTGTFLYLFRHGQSIGNHAGSIVGWTDSKLSVKGRQHANLLYRGLYKNIGNFTQFHSSDLSRCVDSLNICTGFNTNLKPNLTNKLRQLNFGQQEGVHYDSLPQQQKNVINSLEYKPPGGQTWPQARTRAIQYLSTLKNGHHFIMTHGGLICALAYNLGIKTVIPNCSMVCVKMDNQQKNGSKQRELVQLVQKWSFI